MTDATREHKPDDLLSVPELARALGMSETSVWLFAKEHDLPRFRVRARGKTTLFRWEDAWAAYNAPRPVPARGARSKGKAAA